PGCHTMTFTSGYLLYTSAFKSSTLPVILNTRPARDAEKSWSRIGITTFGRRSPTACAASSGSMASVLRQRSWSPSAGRKATSITGNPSATRVSSGKKIVSPASIRASATAAASAPRHSTTALEARSLRGLRRDAEGSQVAETVSEAHDLPPRFSHGRRDERIHALGHCHIGGTAHVVWALPPKVVGTAHRHVQIHSHTTSS